MALIVSTFIILGYLVSKPQSFPLQNQDSNIIHLFGLV